MLKYAATLHRNLCGSVCGYTTHMMALQGSGNVSAFWAIKRNTFSSDGCDGCDGWPLGC